MYGVGINRVLPIGSRQPKTGTRPSIEFLSPNSDNIVIIREKAGPIFETTLVTIGGHPAPNVTHFD